MTMMTGKVVNALHFWITEEEITKWFQDRQVFFVSGMGRSGTEFLARLLDVDNSAAVFHEPLDEDFEAIVHAKDSEQAAREYIANFRRKRMYLQLRKRDVDTYGEVNSALRYHLKAIRHTYPQAKLLHLTRDGRDVVRSLMARQHYRAAGEDHHRLSPKSLSVANKDWSSFNRFERVCWLWSDAINRVEESTEQRIKLESLVDNYEYFYERVEVYLSVDVGRDHWNKEVQRPRNKTSEHIIPHWTKWSDTCKRQFEKICGDQMRQIGYW